MKKQKKKIRMITREFLVSILGQYYLLEYVQPNVGQLPVRRNKQGEKKRIVNKGIDYHQYKIRIKK